jgi:hypothetical protein
VENLPVATASCAATLNVIVQGECFPARSLQLTLFIASANRPNTQLSNCKGKIYKNTGGQPGERVAKITQRRYETGGTLDAYYCSEADGERASPDALDSEEA